MTRQENEQPRKNRFMRDINYSHDGESYYQKVWRAKRKEIEAESKMTAIERLRIERHGERLIDFRAKFLNRGVGGILR